MIAWLCRLAQGGSLYIDVGANIGLTSIPVLQRTPHTRVLSFEPSPSSLPHLLRTQRESTFGDRWEILSKAAGSPPGTVHFFVAPSANAAFDGLRDTGRGGAREDVTIEQTTVDREWNRLHRPPVSCMKVDTEGAESQVLAGAEEMIRSERPHLLLEWNQENLAALNIDFGFLLTYAQSLRYQILALPGLVAVSDVPALRLRMFETESFFLSPFA